MDNHVVTNWRMEGNTFNNDQAWRHSSEHRRD